MITWDNYEEYMMMHADDELKPVEEQELMNFVFQHPELQNEMAAFTMTKMIPDTTLIYTQKATLTKPEYSSKIVPFINWKRSAVAAGLAALVCFSIYKLTEPPYNTGDIASINTTINNTTNNYNNTPANNETPAAAMPAITPSSTKIASNYAATILPDSKTANVAAQTQAPPQLNGNNNVAAATSTTNTLTKDAIDRIEPTFAALATDEKNNFSVAVTNLPDVAIYIDNGQTTQSFLDKLPIDELKKEGMENVASALASGYHKVNAIRHSLSASSISLKLQNKKLTVTF